MEAAGYVLAPEAIANLLAQAAGTNHREHGR